MSLVCRFSHIIVKEFLRQCQPWVGMWSIMGKIWSTQLKKTPSDATRRKSDKDFCVSRVTAKMLHNDSMYVQVLTVHKYLRGERSGPIGSECVQIFICLYFLSCPEQSVEELFNIHQRSQNTRNNAKSKILWNMLTHFCIEDLRDILQSDIK